MSPRAVTAHRANLTGVAQWSVGPSPVSARNIIQTPQAHLESGASGLLRQCHCPRGWWLLRRSVKNLACGGSSRRNTDRPLRLRLISTSVTPSVRPPELRLGGVLPRCKRMQAMVPSRQKRCSLGGVQDRRKNSLRRLAIHLPMCSSASP